MRILIAFLLALVQFTEATARDSSKNVNDLLAEESLGGLKEKLVEYVFPISDQKDKIS